MDIEVVNNNSTVEVFPFDIWFQRGYRQLGAGARLTGGGGTMDVTGAFEQEDGLAEFSNGSLSVMGDLLVSGGRFELTSMALSASADFAINGGTAILDQGSTSISGQMLVHQGTLMLKTDLTAIGGVAIGAGGELQAYGVYVYGTVVNSGIFRPIGTVTITGDYNQTSTGTLRVTLGPVTNDRLNIVGNVSLAGALEVLLQPGFDPQIEDNFVLLEYTSRTGTFDDYLLPSLNDGVWDWWYDDLSNPNSFGLEVIPE